MGCPTKNLKAFPLISCPRTHSTLFDRFEADQRKVVSCHVRQHHLCALCLPDITYVNISPRPSPFIFAYCKCSKTGGRNSLGTRLGYGSMQYGNMGVWSMGVSLVPRPHPKIGKGAWCHLQIFPYVLCQQSSFGVEESRSSIANYNIPSSII